LETRIGARLHDAPNQKDLGIGEVRLQLETEKDFEAATFHIVADFIADPVLDEYEIDLETGEGAIDLRQANVLFSPHDILDLKIGRQILTWGTGDLLFINDLFAKDWNAFLIGRDEEYLKAPSDAIKSSLFFEAFNLDLVYLPRFDADRFIDGKRNSFFDRSTMTSRGRNAPLQAERPNDVFSDDEIAARLYRTFGIYEAALYYYRGFWKSPAGQNPVDGKALFPRLAVYGASLRGPVFQGIAHIESGYYESADGVATNAAVRNSEWRFLAGYEQEIATELTAALQYYLERKDDYTDYLNSLPGGALRDDENRHVITLRLTQLLFRQDLKLSLFNFYSPSDEDGYLRLITAYKFSDAAKIEAGGNVFYGEDAHTFYGQFEDNSNVYLALRYSF